MSEEKRRLAGILAVDVVGYSAMVGADEPGTLARVRTLRTDVIEAIVAEHEGRIFKTTGDGFFVEFASAVQALRCAIAIARLEPLAEPGGICISSRVREDASGKMALEVVDLGEPVLKNIAATACSACASECARPSVL